MESVSQNPVPSMMNQGSKVKWSIVGIIIVGAVVGGIILGVWRSSTTLPPSPVGIKSPGMPGGLPPAPPPPPPPTGEAPDQKTMQLGQYGNSTEVAAIDQDLQNTDLTGLDTEMNAMATEVQ